jgi:TRAP-type C4-dicarboxylate transport system permease small subunit
MNHLLSCLTSVNRLFVIFDKALVAFVLFNKIGQSFGQVVARNVFSAGFIWIDQVLRLEVLWIAFVGAALAAEYNQHIKIDFIANIVRSESVKTSIYKFAQLFTFIICFLLFIIASDYIRIVSTDLSSTVIAGIPDWTFRLIIPYCFFIVAIRSFIHLLKWFGKQE